jgi:hypothetical protein
VPLDVIMKVLDSMVRQKERITNPYAWLVTVMKQEHQSFSYEEAFKEHQQRKKWGLESIASIFRNVS